MNWQNLKKNKCPECNKNVIKTPFEFVPHTKTLSHKCGFRISEQEFNNKVMAMNEDTLEANQIEDEWIK